MDLPVQTIPVVAVINYFFIDNEKLKIYNYVHGCLIDSLYFS
ncbi:MAG: hypothetical protein PARBA_03269 [Parabacteroides sp.]